jgi:acyl transferase domain-containing protein/thioesterase domain-containing protein/acyl carrier protein
LEEFSSENGSEIAVVGMACRFPGARSVSEFWRNLRDGVESISFFTDEELRGAGVGGDALGNPDYVRARGVLGDVDLFDAPFFDFNPREAEVLDPQQRLFLECAWEALETAGCDAETYPGLISVYAGASLSRYLFNIYSNPRVLNLIGSFQVILANDKDHLPTRTSYKLNLRGPSIAVQTSCSTSLVAVHLACQGLLSGDCDLALAGGVSVSSPETSGYLFHRGGILSPDGHCRAFDRKAAGTVSGNGVGVVVLKRLSDALADGDHVEAIIRGSAVNNDGSVKVGYTAPRVEGQADVIAAAQAVAGVGPETIGYVETHGTGTPLGDAIEMAALARVFRAARVEKGSCPVGSVKTNVGHLDTAAGLAGLIKTVLALKHRMIPPSLNFAEPNPELGLGDGPFYVNTELRDWHAGPTPRRAGVSSFGIGGTNAHVIVEEAPPAEPSGPSRPWQLLTLSAKTESALRAASSNLAEHLKAHPEVNLADAAHTLRTGRRAFRHRQTLVCRSASEAAAGLEASDGGPATTNRGRVGRPAVAFAFPGLGEHYVGMGRGLYETEAVFREQIDLCSELLEPHLGLDLRGVMYADEGQEARPAAPDPEPAAASSGPARRIDLRRMLARSDEAASPQSRTLNQTYVAHPALFVVEYALARLWMSWGVKPQAVVGYSIGEYVAACLAGVFSLEDGLALISRRARLIHELPPGVMLAVASDERQLRPLLGERVSISALNGPTLSVVSGPAAAVEELEAKLAGRGIVCRRLDASHAFHSGMMAPVAEGFAREFAKVKLNAPRLPYVSTLTGTWVTAEQATSADYWARHLCEPVRFADGLGALWREGSRLLLEVGPGQTLTSLALQHPARDAAAGHLALPSMRSSYDRQPDEAFILSTLGKLWLAGAEPDWNSFVAAERRRKLALPTYPFERRRYWIGSDAGTVDVSPAHAASATGENAAVEDWLFVPTWKQSPLPSGHSRADLSKRKSCWLVFVDAGGTGVRLASSLEALGQDVIGVREGDGFARLGEGLYAVDPARADDYHELLGALRTEGRRPDRVVHLWGLTRGGGEEARAGGDVGRALAQGFYSLIYLAQSLGQHGAGGPVDLTVVSNSTQQVTGEEELRPEKATVLGPCRVIPQEYRDVNCRSIDAPAPEPGSAQEQTLIDRLLDELAAGARAADVAYREGVRWVRGYERARLDGAGGTPTRLRERGVYLITGGLGGIGLTLAEHLARTVRARLVLTGRSEFPRPDEWGHWLASRPAEDAACRTIRRLQALEGHGAEVAIFSADVADPLRMKNVVAEARERFGRIDGVVHAAGVVGGGIIALKTAEAAERVLAPKVRGALVLDELFRGAGLDFFVLCSSLSSFAGGPGQVDYCAANVFLDAFARARRDGFTVSINWDVWRDVGMIVNTELPRHLKEEREANLRHALSPREGAEAFARILGAPLPQVIVTKRDVGAGRPARGDAPPPRHTREAGPTPAPVAAHERPPLGVAYVAPRSETERGVAEIWQELLGIGRVGVRDDFFELGGHSLLALRLVARLRESFRVELPLNALLESLTVGSLAKLIEESTARGDDPNGPDSDAREGKAEPPSRGDAARAAAASNHLVELRKGATRPLFLIHPAGGTAFCYRHLARSLGPEQTVYGVQARGVVTREPPLESIEEMAAQYLEAIRAVQPEGPYRLAGLSQGGTVAYEMAQQLQAGRERVGLLALLDTPGPGQMPPEAADDAETFVHMFGGQLPLSLDELRRLGPEEQLAFVFEQMKAAALVPADVDPTEARRFLAIWKANMRALERYVPRRYEGRLLFIRAGEWLAFNPQRPELPWIDLAADGIEIHVVPGNHHTMINNPHVEVLARLLRARLA